VLPLFEIALQTERRLYMYVKHSGVMDPATGKMTVPSHSGNTTCSLGKTLVLQYATKDVTDKRVASWLEAAMRRFGLLKHVSYTCVSDAGGATTLDRLILKVEDFGL
jgi:hypothetical protein